jgi:hypothetical protein
MIYSLLAYKMPTERLMAQHAGGGVSLWNARPAPNRDRCPQSYV